MFVRCNGYPEKSKAFLSRSLRMLSAAMSNRVDLQTKKEILENEIGIPMTEKVDRKVEKMCNISSGVYEEGLVEGRVKGRKEGKTDALYSIMKKLGMTAEQAMDMLDIPQKERADYRKELI